MALETTSAYGSLALVEDGRLRAAGDLDPGHYSTQLLAALEKLAAAAGLELRAVDAWAVANGPGSFTGVRVGLAAVKGLVEVWGRPAVTVSTLAAVAEEAGASEIEPIWAALDAARDEVYFGRYPEGEEGVEPLADFRRRVAASRLPVATPHDALAAALGEAGVRRVARRLAPAVARLGWAQIAASAGASDALGLDANYLRRSDAEIFHRS